MNTCIKDLYDYDLSKKLLKCGKISVKSIFHKEKNREDGLQPQCITRRTQYYNENREKTRKYYIENRV